MMLNGVSTPPRALRASEVERDELVRAVNVPEKYEPQRLRYQFSLQVLHLVQHRGLTIVVGAGPGVWDGQPPYDMPGLRV